VTVTFRYFVVERDDEGQRILAAGHTTALFAAQVVSAVPEIDASELAATFNAENSSGSVRYMIGAAVRGEPGYSKKDVGRRWADP
jgi:hypothetical protein